MSKNSEEDDSKFTAENRVKKEMVSLKGLARTEDGKMTTSGYFNFLRQDLDDYTDIEYTPEQARKIQTHLQKLSTGATAMTPMYCAGALCPFATRCPLVQMRNAENEEDRGHPQHGKAPIGKQCLIEVQLMKEWIVRYFQEFEVDPNNFTEVGYVNELADLMVLEMRLNMNLAKKENAELVTDQTVGVTSDGTPIIQKQISPFMAQKERLANRRSKIIKLMVGDRQEKYKMEAALKMKLDTDPSSKMATMRARIESLTRELDTVQDQITTGDAEPSVTFSPQDIIDGLDDK